MRAQLNDTSAFPACCPAPDFLAEGYFFVPMTFS